MNASPLIKAVGACYPLPVTCYLADFCEAAFRPIQAQQVPELEGKSWYDQCPPVPRENEKWKVEEHQSEGFALFLRERERES